MNITLKRGEKYTSTTFLKFKFSLLHLENETQIQRPRHPHVFSCLCSRLFFK